MGLEAAFFRLYYRGCVPEEVFVNDLSFLKEIPDPLARSPQLAPPSPPRFTSASPVRSNIRRSRLLGAGLGILWLATHLGVYGLREDLPRLPPLYLALQVGLPALLGAASLWLAMAPGKLGLGASIGLVSGLAVLGPLSFWLMAVGVPVPYAADPVEGFWLGSLLCLDITLAWAAVPLLLAALVLRRAFPSATLWRSALVGAAVGLLCGAAINLHCANVDASHMLAGHGVPIVLATLLGGLVVSRWARA
ncbi:MAG: hypothetical protein RL033_3195 [Pseudomonadota bacterium]